MTSQANTFARIAEMRELTRAVNPADAMMDFVNVANVNLSFQCAGFFDGASTNYSVEGSVCVNTAYSTVIWHEQGHWQNVRYGSGNGPDGFGEGNADVFGMYMADSPIVGEAFFVGDGPGTGVRDGRNLRQYCGDGNGGCYGQVHADGEVLMGVLWKVRENLQATHGQGSGGDIANGLFFGWMNAYDQGTIDSAIEMQWLTLDDDDADLTNGTPNYLDIDAAFLTQGFPGIVLGTASKVTPRNGTGVNPNVFTSTSPPVIGTTWTSSIDAGSVGGSGFTLVLGYDSALNPGVVLGIGEILVDVTTGLLVIDNSTVIGGIASHGIAVPNDLGIVGFALFTQAYISDVSGSGQVTNALDLCLGTF